MNTIGKLVIDGASCKVIHADGTEEDVRALVTRATAAIGATMSQYSAGDNGNIRLGFDASYFKRKDEITQLQRHQLEMRKLQATVAIAQEFERVGIPVGTWFNVSTSYYDRNKKVWQSTLQIWLNKEDQSQRETNAGAKVDTVASLYEQALIAGVDEEALDSAMEKFDGKDDLLKAKLRAMTIRHNAQSAAANIENETSTTEDLPPQVA